MLSFLRQYFPQNASVGWCSGTGEGWSRLLFKHSSSSGTRTTWFREKQAPTLLGNSLLIYWLG